MSAIKDKFSLKVEELFPGFIRGDDAGVIDFLEKYYEFMESAELILSDIGLVDKILLEEGDGNFVYHRMNLLEQQLEDPMIVSFLKLQVLELFKIMK